MRLEGKTMNRALSTIGIWLAVTSWTTRQALGQESLTAEAFAARCADAEGSLTLAGNLSVVGGTAELGACRVELGASRLEIRQARFFSIGSLFVDGGLGGGELRIEHSQFFQSQRVQSPVNIDLIAHRLRVHDTTVDFSGHVILRGGDRDRSDVLVEAVQFRVRTPTVLHIGASGQTSHQGRITVRDSELISEGDISIQASFLPPHGAGRVLIEGSAIVARGTVLLRTGEDGVTEIRENNRTVDLDAPFQGIHADSTATITSEAGGRVKVDENRILAKEGTEIRSKGWTRVRENNFSDGGPVLIQGLHCRASDNIPDVGCTR